MMTMLMKKALLEILKKTLSIFKFSVNSKFLLSAEAEIQPAAKRRNIDANSDALCCHLIIKTTAFEI